MEAALYSGVLSSGLPVAGKVAFVGLLSVCLVGSFVQPFRRYREAERRRRAGLPLRPEVTTSRRGAQRGGALGALAYGGVGIAQGFFVIGVALGFGWFAFMLFFTLQKEYGLEHDARLRYEGKA